MAIEVLQAGVLATLQDAGRTGHRAKGINPGGAMDGFALRAVNALLGNALEEAVLEMHFPAPRLRFRHPAVICLGGGNFAAGINGQALELWRPYQVEAGSELQFAGRADGCRCYLGAMGGWDVAPWLGSQSTNLVAKAGGFEGRALRVGDVLALRVARLPRGSRTLPWKLSPELVEQAYRPRRVRLLKGPEWDWLTEEAQRKLLGEKFSIAVESNRTGYRLRGMALERSREDELLSGGVAFGTVQLPASGQPIILMADHPVTGGYPRIAQVVSADLPFLAQRGPGEELQFELATQAEAELLYLTLDRHLRQLAEVCRARIHPWLSLL